MGIGKTYIILVEHSKHQRGKFAGVALREKLLVDLNKALQTQRGEWRFFQEISNLPQFKYATTYLLVLWVIHSDNLWEIFCTLTIELNFSMKTWILNIYGWKIYLMVSFHLVPLKLRFYGKNLIEKVIDGIKDYFRKYNPNIYKPCL